MEKVQSAVQFNDEWHIQVAGPTRGPHLTYCAERIPTLIQGRAVVAEGQICQVCVFEKDALRFG